MMNNDHYENDTKKNCPENESNFIYYILIEKEKEYLKKLKMKYGSHFIEKKRNEIIKILSEIENTNYITMKNFETIRRLTLSKGGFLINSFRREFYKKVFILNKHDENLINLISHDGSLFENKHYTLEQIKNKDLIQNETRKKNDYIIEVDVKRSIVNHFFDRNVNENEIINLKEKLIIFLKQFTNLDENYHYYQGFHDIGLYFYLIFFNYEHMAYEMLHRVSEFFLKDYITEIKDKEHFKFETVFNIIKEYIMTMNPKIGKFLEVNTHLPDPIFSLPWIITLFTHDINDPFEVLRIFDYLLFSHPNAIYALSANVRK